MFSLESREKTKMANDSFGHKFETFTQCSTYPMITTLEGML